jgi:argininosuccinate lyase
MSHGKKKPEKPAKKAKRHGKKQQRRPARKRNGLWGGRFGGGPAESLKRIGDSLHFDRRIVDQDLRGCIAHAHMLGAQHVIPAKASRVIVRELKRMRAQIAKGELIVDGPYEDVHSWIESTLTERIGEAGAMLHTARSRNDQVATAFRLWLREETAHLDASIVGLMHALATQAEEVLGVVVPAYTHLQRGQPTLLSHQLMAYVEMLGRDRARFADQVSRMNECPLGAGAATGVPYDIDRKATSDELGFARPTANSMDTVADRDFAIEWLAAASILAVHVSRLAEDVCLWASSEWGLLTLGDSVSTGSSIMPQKRNPDGAELARGKAGRVVGHLMALLTTMKGLPLTYDRDLQEDKEGVFDAFDTVLACVDVMNDTIRHSRFSPEAAARLLRGGHLLATELADFLVGKGIPFRHAHEIVGEVVRAAEKKGVDLSAFTEADLVAINPRFDGCESALDFGAAVDRRDHPGGTATRRVRTAVRSWLRRLDRERP